MLTYTPFLKNSSSVSRGGISQSMTRGGIAPPYLQENFYRRIKFDDSTWKNKSFSFRIDVDIKNACLLTFHQELLKRGGQNCPPEKIQEA